MSIFARSLICSISAGLLAACGSLVQEVDPAKLTKTSSKLVVTCFISPQDTMLTALVALNQPVVSLTDTVQNTKVVNATVTLSDNSRLVALAYNDTNQIYQAKSQNFPITVGHTYTLTVSTPDGKRVTATATIPPPVPISAISLGFTTSTKATTIIKEYFMTFQWNDPSGVNNYYRIAGAAVVDSNKTRAISFQRTTDQQRLLTDADADGTVLTSPQGRFNATFTYDSTSAASSVNYLQNTILWAFLLNTDEMYYQYHKSLREFRNTNDNPFAEPVLVPTNIQGGLGCFAAYNRTLLKTYIR